MVQCFIFSLRSPIYYFSHLPFIYMLCSYFALNTPKAFVGASWLAQMVNNLPAMQENWVRSPGCKDPLEKGMATHSSIIAWRIPWTEEPSRLQSMGSQRVRHHWATNIYFFSYMYIHNTYTSQNMMKDTYRNIGGYRWYWWVYMNGL